MRHFLLLVRRALGISHRRWLRIAHLGLDLVRLFGWRFKPPILDPLRKAAEAKLSGTRGSGDGAAAPQRNNGRGGGWPQWGFVAAWPRYVQTFRRSVRPPLHVGIDQPRISNNETYFRTTKLNHRLRPRLSGNDMFVAPTSCSIPKTNGIVLNARTRPTNWDRGPDGLGSDSRWCQLESVIELRLGSNALVVRTRVHVLRDCPSHFRGHV